MATNLKLIDIPSDPITPAVELAGLYRATYIREMREHFQQMLTGAYAVYVTALGEGFDPTLRAHLTDVLQDIIVRTPELSEIFEQELLRAFQAMLEQSPISDADTAPILQAEPSSRLDQPSGAEEDAAVREFVAKSIRGIDTQRGSIILAVTKAYAKLIGQPVEDCRPPWSPACLFAAFAVVLKHIDVPIHARVRLALYKTFAQEVLRHIGDACLSFRDALPSDFSLLGGAGREDITYQAGNSLNDSFIGLNPGSEAQLGGIQDFPPISRIPLPEENASETTTGDFDNPLERTGLLSEPRSTGRFLRWAVILLLGLGTAWGVWRSGAYLSWIESIPGLKGVQFSAGTEEKPAEAPAPIPASPSAAGRTGPESALMEQQAASMTSVSTSEVREQPATGKPAEEQSIPPTTAPEPPPPVDPRAKREAMRGIKIKNLKWKLASGGTEVRYDLRIDNSSKFQVRGIEIVCSQYARKMGFLEAAKTVLADPIEPGKSRDYFALPIGFASKNAYRVSCVVADLEIVPSP